MCGIFGFNWNDEGLIKRGLKRIAHRGPDGSGVFTDKNISLGHNRLAIIDLSDAGKQPMHNEKRDCWIIFNGEIYNHREIREKLTGNHKFRSNTDTEVLLHLYEEKGFDMVGDLQGMFAFCIYDKRKNLIFLARDRLGVKPLYYWQDGKKFSFASEMKAILEDRQVKRVLNKLALSSYLAFRANTDETTFIEGIKKLMPGYFAVYDLKKNNLKINKYWNLEKRPSLLSKKNIVKEVGELLDDSVKCRLMSDVPFGAFLSGGVDSGIVVSMMGKHSSQPIKTFSVGFEGEKSSELMAARQTSNFLKTNHRELIVKNDSIELLPEIIFQSDEPNADPTVIPTYLLSRFAREHCKVVLTGEGADEIFAGYPQYRFMLGRSKFPKRIPSWAVKFLASSARKLPPALLDKGFKFASSLGEKGIDRLENFLAEDTEYFQYLNLVSIFNSDEQEKLIGKKHIEKMRKYFDGDDVVKKCQSLEIKGSMVEDLLMKLDKNTMAFGLEGRVPYLDYRLVELAHSIPSSYNLDIFGKNKETLRLVGKGLVPRETLLRKKRHFFVPIDLWLDRHLGKIVSSLLSKKEIEKQKIFNWEYIDIMRQNYSKSRLFYARQIWALLVFQIWHKIYIEKESVRF